jgi:YfiH family protein
MLSRVTLPNGVIVYQSRLLNHIGVAHGFSTRIGGVSPTPFHTLNLGNPVGSTQDSPENLRENFSRLLSGLNMPSLPIAWVRQVHGCQVALLRAEGEGEYSEAPVAELRDRFQGQTEADAIVSDVSAAALAIRTADCAPILLASTDGRVVAAIHAGWRGVVAGVIAKAVMEMNSLGVTSGQIVAAIGPAIGVKYFEVGEEVAQQFSAAALGGAVHTAGYTKAHVDLAGAIKLQLRQSGISRMDGGALCTYCNADDFFSHRRDNGITGRMVSLIRPCNSGS